MSAIASIFLDLHLPNTTTWFYFSALLAVALFFKFSRLVSIRNLDIVTMFLLMPGLLLLVESHGTSRWGYIWLLAASGYFLARCLIDLILERRPSLLPNLSLGGLVWLAIALFASLIAVAVRQVPTLEPSSEVGTGENGHKTSTPLDDVVRKPVEELVRSSTGPMEGSRVRLWAERILSLGCHFVIVFGMVLVGWRHFGDLHSGVAAATLYLLLPYPFLLLPTYTQTFSRWDHAWPMALMVCMVLGYRQPLVSGSLFGIAAGSAFFPVITLPIWLSFYWGRGACRFFCSFLLTGGLCLGILAVLIAYQGHIPLSLQSGWTSTDWQPWRVPAPHNQSVWQGIHWAYRMPVFILFVAFVLTTSFWPSPKNLAHVLALNAAVLLGIQFWYADQGGVYILWYLPFLILLVFRPNLSGCRPPPITDDWISRVGRYLVRTVRKWAHVREPVLRM